MDRMAAGRKTGVRRTAERKTEGRKTAVVTTEARADAYRDRMPVSRIRQAEEAQAMADIRVRDRAVSRGLGDRAQKALRAARMIAGGLEAVRAVAGAFTILTAITEECTHREPVGRQVDPEITEGARALLQRLRQRIWRRSGKKKRDASARNVTSVPKRIISMKRMF